MFTLYKFEREREKIKDLQYFKNMQYIHIQYECDTVYILKLNPKIKYVHNLITQHKKKEIIRTVLNLVAAIHSTYIYIYKSSNNSTLIYEYSILIKIKGI